jgi:hypothetical protein
MRRILKKIQLRLARITISKRQQFVFTTVFLTTILILTQIVPSDFRYAFVAFLSVCTFVLTAICLREELAGIEWVTLLTLPTLYSAGVALFYFLLPVRWLTRIPVALLYAVGLYAILLTENIFNVAAIRTIALLRAAHAIGFLLTFATYFLLIQTVFAFRWHFYVNVPIVGALSFILIFQSLYAMELEPVVSRRIYVASAALTFVMMQFAWILSFWPSAPLMAALFTASVFYSFTGIAQQYVVDKMYKRTVLEFFLVCIVVFLIFLVTTRWREAL